jgi:hypothetical protein
MKTPGSRATDSMRIRSPRSAPPVNGEVGSTATMPTRFPSARRARVRAVVIVLFPAPGGPVSPTRRARPTSGFSSPSSRSNPGRWFSTTLTARASAAALPARKSSSSRAIGSWTGGAVTGSGGRIGGRGLVVLVADVAHELLEQVLQRDDAERAAPGAVLADDGEVAAAAEHREE